MLQIQNSVSFKKFKIHVGKDLEAWFVGNIFYGEGVLLFHSLLLPLLISLLL